MSRTARRLIAVVGLLGAVCFGAVAVLSPEDGNGPGLWIATLTCSLFALALLPPKPRNIAARVVGAGLFLAYTSVFVSSLFHAGTARGERGAGEEPVFYPALGFLLVGLPAGYMALTGRWVRAATLVRHYAPLPAEGWSDAEGIQMSADEVLYRCRMAVGPPPRKLWTRVTASYLRMREPAWVAQKNDALAGLFADQERLVREGMVVWGHIVQANENLFLPGTFNAPAAVVFCVDPGARDTLSKLPPIARALFALKGTEPEHPGEAAVAAYLTDEWSRSMGLLVPETISPWLECEVSTIFIDRRHLPNGYLSRGYFPIFVSATTPRYVMAVPARYWPPAFARLWEAGRRS